MIAAPDIEPVTAEVASVKQYEHERDATLDRLHADLNTKAHAAANRAEGLAMAANQTASSTALEIGARVGALESWRKDTQGDIKEINARLGGIETAVKRSPYQQALYALTAIVWLGYGASLLWDRFLGAGAG